jgi:hypothetical protein
MPKMPDRKAVPTIRRPSPTAIIAVIAALQGDGGTCTAGLSSVQIYDKCRIDT